MCSWCVVCCLKAAELRHSQRRRCAHIDHASWPVRGRRVLRVSPTVARLALHAAARDVASSAVRSAATAFCVTNSANWLLCLTLQCTRDRSPNLSSAVDFSFLTRSFQANSASYPQRDWEWVPVKSAVILCGWGVKTGMSHSTCGWTCGWQIKLCDPSLTRAIPARFKDE